jgi:hypothetical protein
MANAPATTKSAIDLLAKYFAPLYPDDVGDLRADANPDRDPRPFAHLKEAAELLARGAVPRLAMHGVQVDLVLDFSDQSVVSLARALTPALRDRLASVGAAGSAENELFNFVVHGSAYLGECIRRNHGGEWSARHPLWESVVTIRSAAGQADIPVFHWWLKSLSDVELGEPTMADRYRLHVAQPTFSADALPIIAPPDRRMPRIKKVRYDVLYKHLKAHLPELKDLGVDFPSPERLAEFELKWLDFHWAGGGRTLIMAGLGSKGLHLFWLRSTGFSGAMFVACDAFPEPVIRVTYTTAATLGNTGSKPTDDVAVPAPTVEVVQIHFAQDERKQVHEVLWWGP